MLIEGLNEHGLVFLKKQLLMRLVSQTGWFNLVPGHQPPSQTHVSIGDKQWPLCMRDLGINEEE